MDTDLPSSLRHQQFDSLHWWAHILKIYENRNNPLIVSLYCLTAFFTIFWRHQHYWFFRCCYAKNARYPFNKWAPIYIRLTAVERIVTKPMIIIFMERYCPAIFAVYLYKVNCNVVERKMIFYKVAKNALFEKLLITTVLGSANN